MTIFQDLAYIQQRLHCKKDQKTNSFNFRNIEDINEALKPLCADRDCAISYTDEWSELGGFAFCTSSATLIDKDGATISSRASVAANLETKNMSIEQSCGGASSYSRRYAVQGLFALDNSDDDPDNQVKKAEAKPKDPADNRITKLYNECVSMGIKADGIKAWLTANGMSGRKIAEYTTDEKAEFEEYLVDLKKSWSELNNGASN